MHIQQSQVKAKSQVEVEEEVEVKLVELSGGLRKNEQKKVGARHVLLKERTITGGCAPNGCVRLGESESRNCLVSMGLSGDIAKRGESKLSTSL